MTIYEKEFQQLKPYDEVNGTEKVKGYDFIYTAGHGYLAVPKNDKHFAIAKKVHDEGYCYEGKHAVYLEEDCQASKFLELIK